MHVHPAPAGDLLRARVPFFNRMAVKLALTASALVLLAISFTAGFIVRFATDELRSTLLQRNEQIATQAANEIGSFINAARRDLLSTADFMQLVLPAQSSSAAAPSSVVGGRMVGSGGRCRRVVCGVGGGVDA